MELLTAIILYCSNFNNINYCIRETNTCVQTKMNEATFIQTKVIDCIGDSEPKKFKTKPKPTKDKKQ